MKLEFGAGESSQKKLPEQTGSNGPENFTYKQSYSGTAFLKTSCDLTTGSNEVSRKHHMFPSAAEEIGRIHRRFRPSVRGQFLRNAVCISFGPPLTEIGSIVVCGIFATSFALSSL